MGLKDTLKLPQLQPARVVVELADGGSRELRPHRDSRKRWTPIVDPLAQLEWVRAELFDKADVTLAVIPNPEMQAVEVPAAGVAGERCPSCGRPVGVDDLERMMHAQTIALTWQDKGVQTTLQSSAQMIAQFGEVIAQILEVQRLQLARPAPAANANAGDGDGDIMGLLTATATKLLGDGGASGLTPDRIEKLGAFLDAMPAPARMPAKQAPPAAPPASSAPKANGANGAH